MAKVPNSPNTERGDDQDFSNANMPKVFDEAAAMAALADVKTAAELKQEQFAACIGVVSKAREKGMAWKDIAKLLPKHGGPELTAAEVSSFFQKKSHDPSPRTKRKVDAAHQVVQAQQSTAQEQVTV